MLAAQYRGEAFAINWHRYVHDQTGKCFPLLFQKTKLLRDTKKRIMTQMCDVRQSVT